MTPLQADALRQTDSFLERKKNQLLATIYDQSYSSIPEIYLHICEHAFAEKSIDENSFKRLNQIQTIIKQFKSELFSHPDIRINEHFQKLAHFIATENKKARHHVRHIDLPDWINRLQLSSRQQALLFKTVMTLQLSCGCSNFCRRCNEWALPGARSHFSHSAVTGLLNAIADHKNDEVSLFGASDPLDWNHEGKNICDVVMYLKTLPLEYSILTKVPKGKADLLKRLVDQKANVSVSVTVKNKTRISALEKNENITVSKQHDTEDLMIPAGLDEDFITIKPSITDGYGSEITPDGAFIIIPTFTSALHPFGHAKIPITRDTVFFPFKKTGRHALLVDYFKPLMGFNLDQKPCYLTDLLDVQIESILLDHGADELTPPGMRSVKEYLTIFEEKARCQRKKMTRSVLRHLKLEFLSDRTFKDLPEHKRKLYTQKIQHHLDLCKKEMCLNTLHYTLSFFLEQIARYTKAHPVKTSIIRFLLNKENHTRALKGRDLNTTQGIQKALCHCDDEEPFDIFRALALRLLFDPDDRPVAEFIFANPSGYDPVGDIFIRRTAPEQGR